MEYLGDVLKTLAAQRHYLYITRDGQVLEAQLARLGELRLAIESAKNMFKEELDGENANLWLCAEELCLGIISCIKMFLDLKADRPDSAWNHLVDAQNFAHWCCDKNHLLNGLPSEYAGFFDDLEKTMFPPQGFNSISIVARAECSLCSSPMPECEHMRGDAYMGERCAEIVADMSFNHVAFVDHPADKKCRVTCYEASKGKMTNVMTLLEEPIGAADRT